jgi:hypothetical protein
MEIKIKMATLRIGSFFVKYDKNSLFIHKIHFAVSGEVADYSDVAKYSHDHVGDGNNVDIFKLSPSGRYDINAIAFTGHGNFLADFETEKQILQDDE